MKVSSVNFLPPGILQNVDSILLPLQSAISVLHAVCDGADTLSCHAPIAPHLNTVENLWDLEGSGPNPGTATY